MKKTIEIKAERLCKIREMRGMSQKVLAGKLNVDSGTVCRWERGAIQRIRPDIFGKLCSALNTTRDDLCGDGPLDTNHGKRNEAQREQMNLSVDAACRNALSLVALRYRVTRQQVVEAAPLLFFIAAEKSLQERRKRLDALKAAGDAIDNIYPPYFPTRSSIDYGALELEHRSIESRDLFGATVTSSDDVIGDYAEDWDEAESNPFSVFLKLALRDVSDKATFDRWSPNIWPTYRICNDEALQLTGGDEEAAKAIQAGAAPLHERPKTTTTAEFAAWARAGNNRAESAAAELLSSLGINGSEGERK
jgi:transcriptional regulator with XRE-family HTH domain